MRVLLSVLVMAAATTALATAATHRAPGCRPTAGLGTVAFTLRHEAVDLATCAERRAYVVTPRPFATVRATGSGRKRRRAIWVGLRPIFSTRVLGDTNGLDSPGPIDLLGWSGDHRWVFFAIDPGGSGSIAADGLILRVVSASGWPARRLGVMLPNSDYLSWCGGRLAFTAGSNRVATYDKRLMVASPPAWKPRVLAATPGRVWGSLACQGNSVVAQSQPSSQDSNFFAARWSLWRVGPDGAQTRLTRPPAGYSDESPAVSRDGRTVMFVRSHKGNGDLYALRGSKLLGPLLPAGYSLGFYGHQDWWSGISWSLRKAT